MLIQKHYSIDPINKRNIDLRHLSQNKITIKKPSEKRISTKAVDRTNVEKE